MIVLGRLIFIVRAVPLSTHVLSRIVYLRRGNVAFLAVETQGRSVPKLRVPMTARKHQAADRKGGKPVPSN